MHRIRSSQTRQTFLQRASSDYMNRQKRKKVLPVRPILERLQEQR